jgi:endonuclease-3 related protein
MDRNIVIEDSDDLYHYLQTFDLLKESPRYWWPHAGTFEVVIGAILTQNSRWEKVELSLKNLRKQQLTSLEAVQTADPLLLSVSITPSGLYNQKAKRLITIAQNIGETFGDFLTFQEDVSREWLLEQKGIGFETADAILNYGCFKETMVVDNYTAKLLRHFGFDYEAYEDLQAWFMHFDHSFEYYATFHGMIVEYCKRFCKANKNIIS